MSRLLKGLGYEVIVSNARLARMIMESRRKNGKLDARTLARWRKWIRSSCIRYSTEVRRRKSTCW